MSNNPSKDRRRARRHHHNAVSILDALRLGAEEVVAHGDFESGEARYRRSSPCGVVASATSARTRAVEGSSALSIVPASVRTRHRPFVWNSTGRPAR
jgi:hypothetical protein